MGLLTLCAVALLTLAAHEWSNPPSPGSGPITQKPQTASQYVDGEPESSNPPQGVKTESGIVGEKSPELNTSNGEKKTEKKEQTSLQESEVGGDWDFVLTIIMAVSTAVLSLFTGLQYFLYRKIARISSLQQSWNKTVFYATNPP